MEQIYDNWAEYDLDRALSLSDKIKRDKAHKAIDALSAVLDDSRYQWMDLHKHVFRAAIGLLEEEL